MLLPIEESTTPVYTTKALPFGEPHWYYLSDLVENYIEDLAARAVHRERMKVVCKSIHLYGEWRSQQNSLLEMFFDYYQEFFLYLVLCSLNHKYALNVLTPFHRKLFF